MSGTDAFTSDPLQGTIVAVILYLDVDYFYSLERLHQGLNFERVSRASGLAMKPGRVSVLLLEQPGKFPCS